MQFAAPSGETELLEPGTELTPVLGEQLDWRSTEALKRRKDPKCIKEHPAIRPPAGQQWVWQVYLWRGVQRVLRVGIDVLAIPDCGTRPARRSA